MEIPDYISPTQVNILTPPDTIQGQVPVTLTNAGTTSAAVNVQASCFRLRSSSSTAGRMWPRNPPMVASWDPRACMPD
jgi:hypothetical protein